MATVGKKIIFVIEGGSITQMTLKASLEKMGIEVVCALTIEEAERKFTPNFDLIVLDACVPDGAVITTIPLVKEFRKAKKYNGLIIGVSTEASYQDALVRAGCSHKCNRILVMDKIIEVLGLPAC
jgi:DNA-binding response OmpR family regulator